MPAVPQAPGVPALSSYLAEAAVVLLTADVLTALAGLLGPQWGIFQGGAPVVIADSVVSMEYKAEWTVSNYPVEQGAFESYDRVIVPFEARVRFATGGSMADRLALLTSLAAVTQDTTLFDVVTPEAVYQSVSITHYDYRRTGQSGVGLLQADVHCIQVRVTTTTQFSNTQSPSGASPTGGGQAQTAAPTSAETAALASVH